MAESHKRTLFVGGLPFDTEKHLLEDVFSNIGPLKNCFVVKDKDAAKSKGFGFVEFALSEDAARAKEEITHIGKRNLRIKYADNRASFKERKQKSRAKREKQEMGKQIIPDGEIIDNMTASKVEQSGKQKGDLRSKLIVRNLSFEANVNDLKTAFSQHGTVMDVSIPTFAGGRIKGFAFVTFDTKIAAIKAMKMSGTKIKGRPVAVDWALAKDRYQGKGKTKKKKSSNESDNMEDNKKSNKNTDSFYIDKTPAMDTTDESVSKVRTTPLTSATAAPAHDSDRASDTSEDEDELDLLRSRLAQQERSRDQQQKSRDKQEKSTDQEEDSSSGSDSEAEEENCQAKSDGEEEKEESGEETGSSSSMEEEGSGSESEEESSEESEAEGIQNGSRDAQDESGESDSELSGSEEEEEEEDSEFEEEEEMRDVEEGKTVFVRNLPYEVQKEELNKAFQKFGKTAFALVVMDPATERSRGTGFVKFRQKTDAEKCLHRIENEGESVTLRGRLLAVTLAVDRAKAAELHEKKKEDKKNQTKDSRNLWLAREGLIRPGTKEAEGFAKHDIDKRMLLEGRMRAKLKNPNTFVSTTRLCFHNLPTEVDNAKLRKVILQVMQDKSVVIDECRVMRDLQRVNNKGVGKSMGFAFVNFTQHAHALQALKKLNNNPEVFGEKKRPILEFSIEDRMKLAIKEKRMERNKLKETVLKSDNKKGTFTGLIKKKKEKKSEDDPTVAKPPAKLPKGMKALPTHVGPKVRHKKREPVNKKRKRKQSANQHKQPPEKKMKMPQKQNKRETADNFDKLVNKYKAKLSDNIGKGQSNSKQKWFS